MKCVYNVLSVITPLILLLVVQIAKPNMAFSAPLPSQEQNLITIFSKYNQRYNAAPNEIQEQRISREFRKAFCQAIPRNRVKGWIGNIDSITRNKKTNGIELEVSLVDTNMVTGGLGIVLVLGNSEYQYYKSDTKPHKSTIFAHGSKLYKEVSMMRVDDKVVFDGEFVPFASAEKCSSRLSATTFFSIFRFSRVKDLGQ